MSDEENTQQASSIEQLQKDLEDTTNAWKRTAADFENYKKRKEGENKELIEFAKEVTVAKLLPTLDSFAQALRFMPEVGAEGFEAKYANWQNGVKGIVIQLDRVLEEMGVKKIEAVGRKFDPHFHEAVREVEGEEDGVIVEELQPGFTLNGKVIRPSQVAISRKAG